MVKVPKGYRSKNVRDTRRTGNSSRGSRTFGANSSRSRGGGLGGGGLAGGGVPQTRRGGCGIGVLLIIGLIVFALMGLPGSSTSPTDSAASSASTGSGGSDSAEEEATFDLVNFVLDDLQNDFWPEEFAEANLVYQDASVNVFENEVRTGGCGTASSAVGPFYCPADNTAYIDIEYMFLLQAQLGAEGDFAQAYIVAHEIAHHVQNLLGINAAVRQAQSGASTADSNGLSVGLELQADCFAGAWARSFSDRGFLDSGDLEEGVGAAEAVGDDNITGSTNQENFTHGSSAQRIEWFNTGFDLGTDSCTTFDGELSP